MSEKCNIFLFILCTHNLILLIILEINNKLILLIKLSTLTSILQSFYRVLDDRKSNEKRIRVRISSKIKSLGLTVDSFLEGLSTVSQKN